MNQDSLPPSNDPSLPQHTSELGREPAGERASEADNTTAPNAALEYDSTKQRALPWSATAKYDKVEAGGAPKSAIAAFVIGVGILFFSFQIAPHTKQDMVEVVFGGSKFFHFWQNFVLIPSLFALSFGMRGLFRNRGSIGLQLAAAVGVLATAFSLIAYSVVGELILGFGGSLH